MTQSERLVPGTVLGRYELLLPIARGGMATVWAARLKGSRGFQKTVAVKTMLPNLSDDPQFEQMFLDEAGLASRIHHPNVAEILDLGEHEEVLYIVMEWVDGEALSVVLRTAKRNGAALPQRIALRIARQTCTGLHAAHELRDDADSLLQLVHRDVSPQNILVTYDGIVKLVDFGVAKAIGRAGGETSAGQLKGKIPYMSPEQAKGGKVDRRTDVFALGIVLYKMTVGVHPFQGDSDMVTMRNIISVPLLPPRARNPNFSLELEQVLLKALHKDPDQRFQTMLEVDRALERVLAITGASVVDDDVGAFVRAVMGDRGQKRRAALRDAVRTADEPGPGATGAPAVVHDALSDILMTNMASGPKDTLLGDRPSQTAAHPPRPSMPNAVLDLASNQPLVLFDDPIPQPPKSIRGIVVAVVAAFTTAALGLALVLLAGPRRPAAPLSPTTATSVTTALPEATTSSSDATAASAATGTSTAKTVSVADLPSDDKPTAGGKKPTGAGSKGGAGKGTATGTAKPSTTQWVPSVQNPGF